MCYSVNYLTKKRLEYARRLKGRIRETEIDRVFDELEARSPGAYFVSGFDHPDLPVITGRSPDNIQLFGWGLIPKWVKEPRQAVDLSNRTLNARGEDMFDKPSFKYAARKSRCLILIDGFFEYHWKGGKSYPYYIRMKSGDPMLFGGLWETWYYQPENLSRTTCSIITTSANDLMKFIHNKPKTSEGSRMPLIIPVGLEDEWLNITDDPVGIEKLKQMIGPYDDSELEAYTVPRLKGKEGVGNSPMAIEKRIYGELESLF